MRASEAAGPYPGGDADAVGYWSALLAFLGVLGYSVAQILQIVKVLRFPWDAILIYGFSLCIPVPFLLAMLALHYRTPEAKRIWTHAGVLFTAIYALYVCLNYVVQLATVIPATLRGEREDVLLLDQTPHSLFWNVDALGYIFMGLATLFAARVFSGGGVTRWAKGFFVAHGAVTPLIAFVYFFPSFSTGLLLLGTPWLVTANGASLTLLLFFREGRRA